MDEKNIEIKNVNGTDVVAFYPQGVCTRQIHLEIKDGIVKKAKFVKGCAGNTQGISRLIIGLSIDEIVERLNGIRCGAKPTSCPDQLSQGLKMYLNEKLNLKVSA